VIDRSADVTAGFTVVVAVALLFAVLGSEVVELTVAVFESGAAAVGVTTIVTVAEAPEASVPRLHVTVAVPEQEPTDGVADTKVTPAGSVSLTLTAAAALGPALAAVSVYVRFVPTVTGSGESVFVIERSAEGTA
jgi:hypothetical protein